jgi:hypothetical protein
MAHSAGASQASRHGAANARRLFPPSDQGLEEAIRKLSTGLQTDSVDNEFLQNPRHAWFFSAWHNFRARPFFPEESVACCAFPQVINGLVNKKCG